MRLHRPSLKHAVALLAGLALAGAGLGLVPHGTHAFDGWCFDDPTVAINGQRVAINLGVKDSPDTVASHIQRATIIVTAPEGVPTALVSQQAGPFPVNVVFVPLGHAEPGQPFPVTITAFYAASVHEPALMQITYPDGTRKTFHGNTFVTFSAPFTLH
jgi:hypothetical protein